MKALPFYLIAILFFSCKNNTTKTTVVGKVFKCENKNNTTARSVIGDASKTITFKCNADAISEVKSTNYTSEYNATETILKLTKGTLQTVYSYNWTNTYLETLDPKKASKVTEYKIDFSNNTVSKRSGVNSAENSRQKMVNKTFKIVNLSIDSLRTVNEQLIERALKL